MIRGLVHQKDKPIIHVHTPNNRALKFTKQQANLKGKMQN